MFILSFGSLVFGGGLSATSLCLTKNMKEIKNIFDLLTRYGIEPNAQSLHNLINNTIVKNPQYHLITDQNGKIKLYPSGNYLIFFRGQTEDYGSCLASINRIKEKNLVMLNRLQAIELELLFKSTPFYSEQDRFIIPLFNKEYKYEIDFLGLAQHYNISTEYLDLTNNILIAAFFATNNYDYYANEFIPVSKGKGVIYVQNELDSYRTNVIGFQPFPRPGVQMAFAIQTKNNEDFSKIKNVDKIIFEQSIECSELLYTAFNSGKFLLPEDPFDRWSRVIKSSNTFSTNSLEILRQRYYKNYDINFIKNELHTIGKEFENRSIFFSSEDLKIIGDFWEKTKRLIVTSPTKKILYVG